MAMLEDRNATDLYDSEYPSVLLNYHAGNKDTSELEGINYYHYKFTLDSKDEACMGATIPKHSRLHPTYKERKEHDTYLDYLDLHGICDLKKLGNKKDKEQFLITFTSSKSHASSGHVDAEATGRAVVSNNRQAQENEEQMKTLNVYQQQLYTFDEMVAKIIEKLNLPKNTEEYIDIYNTVSAQIGKLHKSCPYNDRAVNIVVDWFIEAINWNTPDTKPPKEYQAYLRSINKDKIRKDMLEHPITAKSEYNLRSKMQKQGKDNFHTKFFKENFVPP